MHRERKTERQRERESMIIRMHCASELTVCMKQQQQQQPQIFFNTKCHLSSSAVIKCEITTKTNKQTHTLTHTLIHTITYAQRDLFFLLNSLPHLTERGFFPTF